MCTAALLLMLSPRNICPGPHQTPSAQAAGSVMRTVMRDYSVCISPITVAHSKKIVGYPETKWPPFWEVVIRGLRNYRGLRVFPVLLRRPADPALIKVNQPVWGRSERRSKTGPDANTLGAPRALLVIGMKLLPPVLEMLNWARPYVCCNLRPHRWRTRSIPRHRVEHGAERAVTVPRGERHPLRFNDDQRRPQKRRRRNVL